MKTWKLSGLDVWSRMTRPTWDRPFRLLRQKWHEVPTAASRLSTRKLVCLPGEELLALWQRERLAATNGTGFEIRGWYHELYKDVLRGKKVLDYGCGFGMDGITFAQAGAEVTFVDIVESNLVVIERIASMLGLSNVQCFYLAEIDSLSNLRGEYDVIWSQGSLINAPFEVIRQEVQELLKHLPVGGRWIELAYPKSRWEREGKLPFERWGENTDGLGTPWMEWYDLSKLKKALAPAQFDVILHFEFHNRDFNWFDLRRKA